MSNHESFEKNVALKCLQRHLSPSAAVTLITKSDQIGPNRRYPVPNRGHFLGLHFFDADI